MQTIINILKNHSIDYVVDGERIIAAGIYSGTSFCEWYVVTSKAELYDWLGY